MTVSELIAEALKHLEAETPKRGARARRRERQHRFDQLNRTLEDWNSVALVGPVAEREPGMDDV